MAEVLHYFQAVRSAVASSSQNFRITEWWRPEGTFGGHLVQCPAQAGPPRAGCPGPLPEGFWRSPSKETPQPP